MVALAIGSMPDVSADVFARDDFEFSQGCVCTEFGFSGLEVFELDQGFVGFWADGYSSDCYPFESG